MTTPKLQSVLLVDDNPNDRLLVRRQMHKTFGDISIQEASNQAQLDEAIAKGRYELVITDYQLGWSTGIDVLKTVKQVRPECPVVMFTNTGTEEIAVAAMKLGLDDYVLKTPRHFTRLTQAVSGVWQQFQTSLRAAELDGRLQALLAQLKVGIFRANPEGELLDANLALLKMMGVDSIEAAQPIWIEQLAREIVAVEAKSLPAPSKTEAFTKEIKIETSSRQRAEQKSVAARWLRVSATLNQTTRTSVIDGLVEDITVRKKAQQSLQNINRTLEKKVKVRTQQLESSNRELESFAYSVSHDLRTPIRQIAGLIDLMKSHFDDTPNTLPSPLKLDHTVQHYLDTISELAIRAGNMIESLLNLSKVGRTAMTLTPVDMSAVVEQVIEQANQSGENQLTKPNLSAPEAHRRPATFVVRSLPVINCDRTLIQIVWQNLIDNALKFTQNQLDPQIVIGVKESPKPPGNLEKSTDSEEIVFFIQDNGIGFANNKAEEIFGIFQQAHSKQDFGGSGIGLANVMRIINRHKGRAWAESKADQGATFYFSLPRNAEL